VCRNCCCHKSAFRSASNVGDENIEPQGSGKKDADKDTKGIQGINRECEG
jgi:hypothetical protein